MNQIMVAFIVGSIVGTLISQVFRWHDLDQINKYISENNFTLARIKDLVETNQFLAEELARRQGIELPQEGEKS